MPRSPPRRVKLLWSMAKATAAAWLAASTPKMIGTAHSPSSVTPIPRGGSLPAARMRSSASVRPLP